MSALIDTGFLLAILSPNDRWHKACAAALESEPEPLVPSVIFTELAYMVIRDVGYAGFVRLMRSIFAGEIKLEFPTLGDLERATDLIEAYADSRIDFVDCAVTAMAERLNISRILTVDQRDFRMLRPKHIVAFELLP